MGLRLPSDCEEGKAACDQLLNAFFSFNDAPRSPNSESLVRERPEPQFLAGYLPETREPGGFDDQEEDDQRADNHEAKMLDRRGIDVDFERRAGRW